MHDFKPFAAALAAHFAEMSKHELYRVDINGEAAWGCYLMAFPEGTNPIFRTRTEHDGSYDRNFVRHLGNVVRILPNGTLQSIWNIPGLDDPYNIVAHKLAGLMESRPIVDLFRSDVRDHGYESTIERLSDGTTRRWNHFHAKVGNKHITVKGAVDECLGAARTTIQVMKRGLEEIKPQAISDVLELVNANQLYRGAEFQRGLIEFAGLQIAYNALDDRQKNLFLWKNIATPAARFRNTVIGTLLIDLSEGDPLDVAVRSFEQKVAPANYKRPTAVITEGMIKTAMKTIEELGIEPSLARRHAALSDISVNNVLWVDNSVRSRMKDGLKGLLHAEVKPKASASGQSIAIGITEFMAEVLPNAVSLEVFFSGANQGNLMSLTTAVDVNAPPLFKWDNNFAWSYNGNVADSIKEKVKAAGGNTNAALRVSLAWYNGDDLDIHAICPNGHIYFCNKAGILDVDMNAGGPRSRTPVENLSWSHPRDGQYEIKVNQYNRRETGDVGFTVEVENAGKITQYSYAKAVSGTIPVIDFTVKAGKITDLTVHKNITGQGIQQQRWGLTTETFVPVNTVLHSPNFWDGKSIGNLHTFFILEGCLNPEEVRGIFNEFLRPELEPHRKVLEVVGNKTKCPTSAHQLSGLGFSSTNSASVTFRVTFEKSVKTYNVTF